MTKVFASASAILFACSLYAQEDTVERLALTSGQDYVSQREKLIDAKDFVPNPVTMTALWATHRRGDLNKEYGRELQNKYRNNPDLRPQAEQFYKEMLDDDWLNAFPSY